MKIESAEKNRLTRREKEKGEDGGEGRGGREIRAKVVVGEVAASRLLRGHRSGKRRRKDGRPFVLRRG